jgi:predicted nucleotidyltransferase
VRIGNVETSLDAITLFCQRWNVAELSLFGSVLTLENRIEMREQLSALFGGRKIDLLERALVQNPFRRHEILNHRRVLYAA